jgi:hypothetical protein
MARLTPQHFLTHDIPHRLAVLRGFRYRSPDFHGDTFRAAMDGAMVTCRSVWEVLGAVRKNPKRGRPTAPPLTEAKLNIPPGVNVRRFNANEIKTLNDRLSNNDPDTVDLLKVLVGGNSCVAHLDDDADHEVADVLLDRVIDRTIQEIKDRIPGVPQSAFDRPQH